MDKGNSANPAYRGQAQAGAFHITIRREFFSNVLNSAFRNPKSAFEWANFFMHNTAVARSRTNI
jgi:hypothetical protein